eukprot:c9834_g1_i5.p2 GENE.c9834_g1_i5~~c9834_g1_i5.p2  ORF type:complete len:118 (+),score=18.91 c9834_g1_i5:1327-1680(+)
MAQRMKVIFSQVSTHHSPHLISIRHSLDSPCAFLRLLICSISISICSVVLHVFGQVCSPESSPRYRRITICENTHFRYEKGQKTSQNGRHVHHGGHRFLFGRSTETNGPQLASLPRS